MNDHFYLSTEGEGLLPWVLPCFYSSPECTNQTLALEGAFCVLHVLSRHHRGGCDKGYFICCSLYNLTHWTSKKSILCNTCVHMLNC